MLNSNNPIIVGKVNQILKDEELSKKLRRRIEELLRKSPLSLGQVAVDLVARMEIRISDLVVPNSNTENHEDVFPGLFTKEQHEKSLGIFR